MVEPEGSLVLVADDNDKKLGWTPSAFPPDRVRVKVVEPGSWANARGLVVGDELVAVNGKPATDMGREDLGAAMRRRPLRLCFAARSTPIVLDMLEGHTSQRASFSQVRIGPPNLASFGPLEEAVAREGDEHLGMHIGSPPPGVVVVRTVTDGGWAQKAGLQPGSRVVMVNGEATTTMLADTFRAAVKGRPLRIQYAQPLEDKKSDGHHQKKDKGGPGLQEEEESGRDAAAPSEAPRAKKPAEDRAPPRTEARTAPAAPDGGFLEVVAGHDDRTLGVKPSNWPPGLVHVALVEERSWAERSGIKVGSAIAAVNDEDCEKMEVEVFKSLLRQRPLRLKIKLPLGTEDKQADATPATPDKATKWVHGRDTVVGQGLSLLSSMVVWPSSPEDGRGSEGEGAIMPPPAGRPETIPEGGEAGQARSSPSSPPKRPAAERSPLQEKDYGVRSIALEPAPDASEAPPIQQGWLEKRGPTMSYKWLRRWCVLSTERLSYYEDEKRQIKKGHITIKSSTCALHFADPNTRGDAVKHVRNRPFGFVLDVDPSHGRHRHLYYFDAGGADIMKQWCQAIEDAARGLKRLIIELNPTLRTNIYASAVRLIQGESKATSKSMRGSIYLNSVKRLTAAEARPRPAPLVICGPSGVGKGKLIERLMGAFPGRFGFCVSHTTRVARPGEVDGKHYNFVDRETMQRETEAGEMFLEHAEVHGNLYGTAFESVEAVLTSGLICVLDVDVQGARKIKASGKFKDAKFLFIAPPSIEDLKARLEGRGTESEEEISTRILNAEAEIEFGKQEGSFDRTLVNGNLDVAEAELLALARAWYPALLVGGGGSS